MQREAALRICSQRCCRCCLLKQLGTLRGGRKLEGLPTFCLALELRPALNWSGLVPILGGKAQKLPAAVQNVGAQGSLLAGWNTQHSASLAASLEPKGVLSVLE